MEKFSYHLPSDDFPKNLPLLFKIAQAIVLLTGGRGEYSIRELLKLTGTLKGLGKFPFFGGAIYIPLANSMSLRLRDFSLFQGLREINFANAIYANLKEFTLIDCGAAFGQVSMRMSKLCPNLIKILAIDPNKRHCEILEKNFSMTEIDFEVLNIGVSDFSGNAEIIFPNGIEDPYSAFVRATDNGPIAIRKIDDVFLFEGGDVALKIDVEGEEIAVIKGAAKTIRRAKNVCLFIEIHPEALNRKGHSAEDILREVSGIRKIKWVLSEQPMVIIDENRPFFDQVPEVRQYDIIGISEPGR